MDERRRATRPSFPASAGNAHGRGLALQGRGFFVWDEDAARARSMALELGFAAETRAAPGAPPPDRPRLSSR